MDKVALVTGSGSGIGRATALALAARGHRIVVNDLNESQAQETARLIADAGGEAIVSLANVARSDEVERMFAQVDDAFGRLDVLVNNAGITRDAFMDQMTEKDWDLVMEVNLKGVFLCSQAAARRMAVNGFGRIVNLTSVTGLAGNIGQLNYAASKGGVVAMTKTLARELAPAGITANAVAPGFIKTAMTAAVPDKVIEKIVRTIPLGRQGEPVEIADTIAFLASDEAAYITGQVISVNGGMYI